MAEIAIHTERVDDIPLLLEHESRMGIPEVLDEMIKAHGNHEGLSIGWLSTVWLVYILSEADHRMSEVEPWAEQRLETLSRLIGQPVRGKDFTDDRLAAVLRYLGDDTAWETVEARLGEHLVRVYDLTREVVRLDSTTAAVYHNPEGYTLFRYGQSKDHRPDLAQFKVMLASLDPLGMPLVTLVVPGNETDDGLYLPALKQARQVVGQGGRLYIGDVKMAALATRASLQAGGDYYLSPLPSTGEVPEFLRSLIEPVWSGKQALQRIYGPAAQDEEAAESGPAGEAVGVKSKVGEKLLALGFETTRMQQAEVDSEVLNWEERVLVVYSLTLAKQTRKVLGDRLRRAEQALLALTPQRGKGRRQKEDLAELQAAVRAILKQRRVEGLLEVSCVHEVEERSIRGYGRSPGRIERQQCYKIEVKRNEEAINRASRLLGWRLYVNNAPRAELSLSAAVLAYRGAPIIERDFRRLKGHPLGIRPLYVQREDHARGLVRLLSLAIRVLTLVEYVARGMLKDSGQSLGGLYAGNPKRETTQPTTERLLRAFTGITLTVVGLPEQTIQHVTALSPLQQRILTLLGLSDSTYEQLAELPYPIPP